MDNKENAYKRVELVAFNMNNNPVLKKYHGCECINFENLIIKYAITQIQMYNCNLKDEFLIKLLTGLSQKYLAIVVVMMMNMMNQQECYHWLNLLIFKVIIDYDLKVLKENSIVQSMHVVTTINLVFVIKKKERKERKEKGKKNKKHNMQDKNIKTI